jgi:hypothetical protein
MAVPKMRSFIHGSDPLLMPARPLSPPFGRATGDVKKQIQGNLDQAVGAAQDLYGQTADAAAAGVWVVTVD